MKTVYLFREDLRLFDNPALTAAAKDSKLVLLFVYPSGLGGASYWWLHHSLKQLQAALHEHQIELVLRAGDAASQVLQVAREVQADRVVWSRVYSPAGIEFGKSLKHSLAAEGITASSYNGQLLIEPSKVLNKQGSPYKVFTPFWRACRDSLEPPLPLPVPQLIAAKHNCHSDSLDDWQLLPTKPNWASGLAQRWQPGEAGAQQRWESFVNETIEFYKEGRDFPAREDTSMLSPHLAFGEISVRQIWHELVALINSGEVDQGNGNKYLAEIGWREFSRYLLVHFPQLVEQPFNSKFLDFPWQNSAELLAAWQQGKTGYPIVDAGMRELWTTGYMHNRVRMIVASFLTKHCLLHWQLGAEWFWDTLVDADIGNNTASWQWVAGCGADAAPFFRIFNPILQSEKFDKNGTYIRTWVPELQQLPNKHLHKPWAAGADVLEAAGVVIGESYPAPVVDHQTAREQALAAYQAIKSN